MSAVQLLQIPISAPVSEDSGSWSELLKLLRKAEGNLSTTWALQEEDSKIAGIAANWKSYNAYKGWTDTDEYTTANKLIESVASGKVYDEVVVFPENADAALGAPAVELVSWIYPVSKLTEEHKKKIETGFANFKAPLSKTPQAAGDLVGGWAQTDFDHDGVPSRRWTLLIGWKSVEDHYACKKTQPFIDNIHWLMENDHVDPVDMVHYAYSSSK